MTALQKNAANEQSLSVLLQVQQNQHIFVAVKLFPFQSTFDPNLTSEN